MTVILVNKQLCYYKSFHGGARGRLSSHRQSAFLIGVAQVNRPDKEANDTLQHTQIWTDLRYRKGVVTGLWAALQPQGRVARARCLIACCRHFRSTLSWFPFLSPIQVP